MPTKKQLSQSMESQFEFPQTRREDDPMYQQPKEPSTSNPMTPLTPQQTKRIEKEAKDYANINGFKIIKDDDESRVSHKYATHAYISGATAEALRSKELVSALEEIRAGSVTGALKRIDINKIAAEAIKNYNS